MAHCYALVTHGGAGRWAPEHAPAAISGMQAAAHAGIHILAAAGSALDAVCAAVAALEDHPLFNAGTGSVLNRAGEVEMDAAVMLGEAMRCGAVAAVRRVKNPILVARKVLDATDHVLLVASGAERFARDFGFADYDPVTATQEQAYRARCSEIRAGEAALPAQNPHADPTPKYGTVGAVALDSHAGLAAATSTGGIWLKLPGRVGDTAIPGAGTYATCRAAASATGHGETLLRLCATKTVCDLVAAGAAPQQAAEQVLARLTQDSADAGLIALDHTGAMGVAHTTESMPHAFFSSASGEMRAAMAR